MTIFQDFDLGCTGPIVTLKYLLTVSLTQAMQSLFFFPPPLPSILKGEQALQTA
jgi:hypothetical protein